MKEYTEWESTKKKYFYFLSYIIIAKIAYGIWSILLGNIWRSDTICISHLSPF